MDSSWVTVSLVWAFAISPVIAETVPCMTTREECARTGFTSMSIINNHYRCCAPGYSMSMVNAVCSCTKFAEVMDCKAGPCRMADSVSTDWQGNTRCCPPGYGMSSQSSVVNGIASSSCTCSRSSWSGGSNIFIGNGMVSGTSGDVNTTALAERLQNWRQRFQQRMSHSMQRLSGQMQAMASQISGHMSRMGSHMASVFGNMFRGW